MSLVKKTDIFFYLNLFCNDKCDFCFFSGLPPRKNFLTLENVKEAIKKLKKERMRGIILTGGEPTLNPFFWEIMDYLYNTYIKTHIVKEFDLSTNAITSSNMEIVQKIEKYFTPFDKNYPDIKISFSFSSFRDSNRQEIINKKIQGINNLMKINGNVESVITVTRDNYSYLLSIINLLVDFYKKKKTKKNFFKIDCRLPYASMIYSAENLRYLTVPFKDFYKTLNKALDLLRKYNIYTTLHNIPLCYIKNKPEYFIGRKPPTGIAIFPDKKTGFIKRKLVFKFHKNSECHECRLEAQCSGMEKIYLEKYNYSDLKAFI